MDNEKCVNPLCPGPKNCLLKEFIKSPVNAKDLNDNWQNLVDKCPNAYDLFPKFQSEVKRLEKLEQKPITP